VLGAAAGGDVGAPGRDLACARAPGLGQVALDEVGLIQGGGVRHLPVVHQQPADGVLVVAHDVGGETAGERQQFVVRHHVVDQADGQRLGCGQEVAGQRHLDGAPQPDRPRQQDGHAAAWHDADARVGVGETGPV
jgi:hypothetical protein